MNDEKDQVKKEEPKIKNSVYGMFLGDAVKIKRKKGLRLTPDNDIFIPNSYFDSERIYNIDAGTMYSYIYCTREVFRTSSDIINACRRKRLVPFTEYNDNELHCSNMAVLIMRRVFSAIDIGTFIAKDGNSSMYIESKPGKSGYHYFQLCKDSDTLGGLSVTTTNYLIDNAAAIYRMRSHMNSRDYLSLKPVRDVSTMYQNPTDWIPKIHPVYGNIDKLSLINNHKELKDALDIRSCMLGDIEYIMTEHMCPVYCFINGADEMTTLFYPYKVRRRISPYFGFPVKVITNPDALFAKENKNE